MPVFPKPQFPFEYDLRNEITRLRKNKKVRVIPRREQGKCCHCIDGEDDYRGCYMT